MPITENRFVTSNAPIDRGGGVEVTVCWCFFFQAEDGIRDYKVTGVQTCALPIWYIASGPGVSPNVKLDENTISLQGTLPAAFKAGEQIAVYADVTAPGTPPAIVDQDRKSVV